MSWSTWQTAAGSSRLETGSVFGAIKIGHKETSCVSWENLFRIFLKY